jgi:hypothetical protein
VGLTLAEAALLSNDVLVQGVIETIVKEGGVLSMLPFEEMSGNAITYNRESVLPGVDWYAVGDTWAEGTKTSVQKTATLSILGGDADVDRYLQMSRSNVNDQEALEIEAKAKALNHEFEDVFVYGSTDADANQPDGLHEFISDDATGQQVHQGSGSTPAALSLAKLDEMIDLVKPGKPDFLLMSRRTRRGLSAYARALTSPVQFEPSELGRRVMFYDQIPCIVSDFVVDTEVIASAAFSAKTGGASTSIFAVKLGMRAGVFGFTNGGLQVEDVGALETKDARRWRVKMYCGLALGATLGVARLDGISSAAVVA